ncbi:MAG: 3-oxo-5alpha-steroid 4-dehydrogenase [Zhongshania aliphaticivorans]|jgi:3-oxo-5alpha-steroid 4-dehydrogenase|uniref:FAD-binding protein n=1 Tax=Zhongshania aliphaticivorans TaxID=1470434 RepID=UPI0039E6FE16|tara:strand:- start:55754 stop:57439 length:1686 start_codon:yes stop_codon:yes gene_type:complete
MARAVPSPLTQLIDSASYVANEPLLASDAADFWSDDTDVLVVGLGAAGASAALEARAQGKRVTVLERFEGGGATALSGGIYYGGATEHLQAAGFDDTPEQMYAYLHREIAGAVSDATLRDFCDNSSANLKWLESYGVAFGSRVDTAKRSYPRAGYDLYYSGNERANSNASVSTPAPRGHRVSGKGFTGSVLAAKLIQSAEHRGVIIKRQVRVTRLIVSSSGAVVGVEALAIPAASKAARIHQKLIAKINRYQRFIPALALATLQRIAELEASAGVIYRLRAHCGVILATGSFAFNRAMVNQYAANYIDAIPVGTVGCDGSGIRLGQSVGGAISHMDRVSAWRSLSPPISFVKGIVVNKAGQRFVAEDVYLGHLGRLLVEQEQDCAWLIVDKSAIKGAYREALPKLNDNWLSFGAPLLLNLLVNLKKSASLSGLAEKCAIDEAGLSTTVSAYNNIVAKELDPLEKSSAYLQKIESGPYYALNLSTKNKLFPCPSIPMGGLKVEEHSGAVLHENGRVIQGLYAVGRCAVGIPAGFYISGTSLADCVYSGRRAAKHACQSMANQ